ncbi:hypothetical protein LTR62_003534 [Meristemomyces frigidus]|uniref:Uncharacterized protein n=1 Tax=Meristemomyces frigidus TaxID=1508187 RepID=A0AAN7TIZ4_9PEZI|nr:hypothetical protein LTR62_003534 [Meristemomyces frigidus]
MEVTQGRIAFHLDGKETILTPESGVLFISRLHVHGFKFFAGEAAVFTEKTDPGGDFKESLFEDMQGPPTFITALRSFYDGDTYMALPGGIKLLDEAFITVVGGIVKWMYPRKKKVVVPSASITAKE